MKLSATSFVRAAACAVWVAAAACTTGIDPRRFCDLQYGMERAAAERTLGSQPDARWRVLPDRPGTAGEWWIDVYRADHPHPTYFVASRDGQLVSVLTRAFVPAAIDGRRDPTPADFEEVLSRFEAERHPLDWRQLEAIDREQLRDDLHPTTYTTLVVLMMPPVWLALPFVPVMLLVDPWMAGDLAGEQGRMIRDVLSLPAGSTQADVAAVLGPPTSRRPHGDDPRCELWNYRVRPNLVEALGCRLLFEDGRLVWTFVRPVDGALPPTDEAVGR